MSEPTNPCDVPIPIGVCGGQYQWRPCGNPAPCQRHTLPVAPKPSLSEPTKEQIEKARAWMARAGAPHPSDVLLAMVMGYAAAETAPLHEKIASLEQQLAALAPPAQTQQGLSEDDLGRKVAGLLGRDWAGLRWRQDGWPLCPFCGEDELFSLKTYAAAKEIYGCYRCNWRPVDPVDLSQPVAPLNLEKQPSPAAAPAPLSEGQTPPRGRARMHAEQDQKALRAAALEEAAKVVEDADEGAHGQDYQLGDVAEFRHRVAAEIRALAGSPAQQGQLTKEGAK